MDPYRGKEFHKVDTEETLNYDTDTTENDGEIEYLSDEEQTKGYSFLKKKDKNKMKPKLQVEDYISD